MPSGLLVVIIPPRRLAMRRFITLGVGVLSYVSYSNDMFVPWSYRDSIHRCRSNLELSVPHYYIHILSVNLTFPPLMTLTSRTWLLPTLTPWLVKKTDRLSSGC
jgi:hypothetical protein